MAHLDEILSSNAQFATQPQGPKLTVDAKRELCVITCMDPRLMRFFPVALGLERGDAVLIRVPGAVLTAGDGLRMVAATVYINHAKEFLVLGHTDCGTTKVDVGAVTSMMQKAGVSTDSMPGGIRAFLGAVDDQRKRLKETAALIRAAAFLPRSLLVHVAILDIETGKLEVIERGEEAAVGARASSEGLGYTPGRVTSLLGAMESGASLLEPGVSSAIFGSSSALTPATNPFAPSANPFAGGPQASVMDSPRAMVLSSVNLSPRAEVPLRKAASPQAAPTSEPAPTRKKASPAPRPALPTSGEVSANVDKVADFYRLEFTLDKRRKIARDLDEALNKGRSSEELARIAIKPVLDLGQKRYRVIDELIAVKEHAVRLAPDEAYVILSHLIDQRAMQPLVIHLHAEGFERAHQALNLSLAAREAGQPVTIVIAFGALRALGEDRLGEAVPGPDHWCAQRALHLGSPSIVELHASALKAGVRFLANETVARLSGLDADQLEGKVRLTKMAELIALQQGAQLLYL